MLAYEAALRGIIGEQVSVCTGLVLDETSDDDWGVVLTVELEDGRQVSARPAWLGGDGGNGVFTRIPQGSEVIVLMPYGNANACVAIMGGASSAQRPPEDWTNDSALWLVDEDRVRVQRPGTKDLEGVLKREYLDDLSTFLSNLRTVTDALGTAFTNQQTASVGPLAPLASGFGTISALFQILGTHITTFKTPVDTSKAGLGGAPHCSDLLVVPTE